MVNELKKYLKYGKFLKIIYDTFCYCGITSEKGTITCKYQRIRFSNSQLIREVKAKISSFTRKIRVMVLGCEKY